MLNLEGSGNPEYDPDSKEHPKEVDRKELEVGLIGSTR